MLFKKNSPELKILLANIILVFAGAVITAVSDSSPEDFALYFGLWALGIGLLDLPVAVVLLLAGKKEYGLGFLITGGILLLLSGISCGGYAVLS